MVCPKDCSRFQSCSANVCPCDTQWEARKHLDDDRVCYWLIKAARNETPNKQPEVWNEVMIQAPAIWDKHTRIRNKCFKN